MSLIDDGGDLLKNIENAAQSGSRSLEEELLELAGQLSYPETAYYLPISYALTGIPVRDGDTARDAYQQAGKNTLVAGECIMASRKEGAPEPYTGFIGDTVLRRLGYSLVDGSILGLGLLAGSPATVDAAAAICREMQEKYLLTFLAGEVIPILQESGVKVGLEYRLVPLGPDGAAAIHFADIIARVAMMFGGVQPGDAGRLLSYAAERARAFIIAFPDLEDTEISVLDAMRVLGIPVLTFGGYTGEEWIPAKPDEVVRRGMELRDIKVNIVAIPIPMACSPAFEGKSIRKEETYVEFGGGRSPAFELLRMRPLGEVQDGRVEVVGPEVEAVKEGSVLPLAIIVDVAGKKMKKEYEPVFERRIHTFLNYGEGSWHVAQRDLIWVRISKEAVKKGVKIKDLGTLLASKFRMDFPDHIDAVQVTLITEEGRVRELLGEAEKVYEERDARLEGMKDEDVDTFYSCTLCQTFAPNHVCIITPERPALCGAITWLDAKIAHEISPAGANQPVPKGEMIDEVEGEFAGVNRFVKKASHGEVSRCALYTIMNNPMTSCGCFECVAAIVPEVNGILVVNRDYQGQTPLGMTFSTLAGTIGGGSQTPGFVGISKNYILSDRFLAAENGILRVVWMPSILKEELGSRLQKTLKEKDIEGLYEKIADEKNAPTIEALVEYLEKVDHPALSLKPLI